MLLTILTGHQSPAMLAAHLAFELQILGVTTDRCHADRDRRGDERAAHWTTEATGTATGVDDRILPPSREHAAVEDA